MQVPLICVLLSSIFFTLLDTVEGTSCVVSIPPQVMGNGSLQWNFNRQDLWSSLPNSSCGLSRQSPINIVTQPQNTSQVQQVITVEYMQSQNVSVALKPSTYEVEDVNVSHINVLDASGVTALYTSVQFHLHEPAEHTIDGHLYPLELHFVHIADASANNCSNLTNKLTVFGVFVEVDDTTQNQFFTVWENATDKQQISNFNLYKTLLNSLPQIVSGYSYSGSLTTPPCSESVNWIILNQTIKMTSVQLQAVINYLADTQKFKNNTNNRPPQPLNNRTVSQISFKSSEVVQFSSDYKQLTINLVSSANQTNQAKNANHLNSFIIILFILILNM